MAAAGIKLDSTTTVLAIIFAIYFLFPANLLIYGINDIYDYDTDKLNPKKIAYETLVVPEEQKDLFRKIFLFNIPFIIGLFFINWHAIVALAFFVFFACFYSATPIRAKARPILDALFSAGHYVATGVFGYYLVGGTGLPLIGIAAGVSWAVAMHAFSAVPDIQADTAGGLATIATKLGGKSTIVLCALLYALSAILAKASVGPWTLIFGAIYVGLMAAALAFQKDERKLFGLYKLFPTINTAIGGIIFLIILIKNL